MLHLQGAFLSGDVFLDVVPLCERNSKEMKEVFHNPEQVMGKFILNIFYGKLQVIIKEIKFMDFFFIDLTFFFVLGKHKQ